MRRSASSPSAAEDASSTLTPSAASISRRIRRFVWLSSTISMRRPPRAARPVLRDAGAVSTGSEIVKENSLPRPNSLRTVIAPPMSRTSRCEIARPRPVPP